MSVAEFVAALADQLAGTTTVAVGAASPAPAAAALLAQARPGGPRNVILLGSRRHNAFTDGGRELFDAAGQGRIDAFFLGGGQIDGSGSVNLVGTGAYPRLDRRFPGSFGSAYLAFVVPRVILFREEHSPRVLVPRVDFVSAPGTSPPGVVRPGGPVALVTSRCVFAFDRGRARFRLERLLPGATEETVRAATGFDYDVPPTLSPGTALGDLDVQRLREVAAEVAETYPAFAERLGAALG